MNMRITQMKKRRKFLVSINWIKKLFKTHTNERSCLGDDLYICLCCNKGFEDKTSLEAHEKNTNDNESEKKDYLFTCQICNKQYTQTMGLEVHMRTHTGSIHKLFFHIQYII